LGILEILYIFIFSEKFLYSRSGKDEKCQCGNDCDCYRKGSDQEKDEDIKKEKN
jgi:hypothetical protein